jgi:hypothetical protein
MNFELIILFISSPFNKKRLTLPDQPLPLHYPQLPPQPSLLPQVAQPPPKRPAAISSSVAMRKSTTLAVKCNSLPANG